MRCKNHTSDLTSTFAVCATCLRERLTLLLQAQAQARLTRVVSRASDESSTNSSNLNHDNLPPPLIFPRSVSPYHYGRNEKLFDCTPQVGSTFYGGGVDVHGDGKRWKKCLRKLWSLSDIFRSRPEKFRSDQSCKKSSSVSPSWFSKILDDRRKNCDRFGMSPARGENFAGECNQTTSTSGCSSDSTPIWRRTPPDATAMNSTRRSRLGLEKSVSDSGMAFWLSPLVRLNHNGLPPEIAVAAAKPHLSAAASFSANRSRKLADFGKVNYNR
ncbi:hypothetical protein TanjilG_10496 [Lupinus angustifolius]|uniref:Uncharacterized protein n=1 Tax=Lupinus angustifolius TaxID=3871 RepID=A0A4P1R597_LUPAN|nr:PREDICTED: uncharacterized protein LOC109360743 [Lupinus angustifolius]OIW01335.1 hypothetical protein TanjilG_10496 [Lupinus angustifolius]